jgi:hypothetical protein
MLWVALLPSLSPLKLLDLMPQFSVAPWQFPWPWTLRSFHDHCHGHDFDPT